MKLWQVNINHNQKVWQNAKCASASAHNILISFHFHARQQNLYILKVIMPPLLWGLVNLRSRKLRLYIICKVFPCLFQHIRLDFFWSFRNLKPTPELWKVLCEVWYLFWVLVIQNIYLLLSNYLNWAHFNCFLKTD